ncbi:MAG TPA: MobH family relaxase [Gammaproteobacteria bacterium]|nr:MobH family relaxase [Gammaproteobacteria bacterium]
MIKFLTRLFSSKSQTKPTTRDAFEEVPRYPPYARGFPATDVDELLESQKMLIRRIVNVIGLRESVSNELVIPVIRNFAEFVHHLPATKAHHHSCASGMFRHGLEVAHWAVLSSRGVVFTGQDSGERCYRREQRWRYLVFLIAICHDIGRAATNIRVTNFDGSLTWSPINEPLLAWLKRNHIDRYFVNWLEGRDGLSESFNKYVDHHIISPKALECLDVDMRAAYMQCLIGAPISRQATLVNSLVKRADSDSVEQDLMKRRELLGGDGIAVPVARFVCDAMRRLLREEWTVNQPDSKVWVTPEGVHIVWRPAVADISALLSKDNVPGIPRNPDTLADILFEQELACRPFNQNGAGIGARYWRMSPAMLGNTVLYVLRLNSVELFYDNAEPAPTPVQATFFLPGESPFEEAPRVEEARVSATMSAEAVASKSIRQPTEGVNAKRTRCRRQPRKLEPVVQEAMVVSSDFKLMEGAARSKRQEEVVDHESGTVKHVEHRHKPISESVRAQKCCTTSSNDVKPTTLTGFLLRLREGCLGITGQETQFGIRYPLNPVIQKAEELLKMPRFIFVKNLRSQALAVPKDNSALSRDEKIWQDEDGEFIVIQHTGKPRT